MKNRNFVIVESNGVEHGLYHGRQPRQAALKVANKCSGTIENPSRIMLRERGDKKIHVFDCWCEIVDAPKNKPVWMPDKIKKPNVKKICITNSVNSKLLFKS